MSQRRDRDLLPPAFLTAILLILVTAPVAGQAAPPLPAAVNVLEDCWTTDRDLDKNLENELYSFTTEQSIEFVWKHKILETCPAYNAKLWIYPCRDGKPWVGRPAVKFNRIPFGPIEASPEVPEQILGFSAPPGSIPPGRYDWILLTECADTNGTVWKDGDIDDECGINVGSDLGRWPRSLILGPEPIEALDPDPGGVPPGRGPGEEGTTRPWCFTVAEAASAAVCPCWSQEELEMIASLPPLPECTCRAWGESPPMTYWTETGPTAQYLELAVGTLTETCKDCTRAVFGFPEWPGSVHLRLVNLTDEEVAACAVDVQWLGWLRHHTCWEYE